MDVSVLNLSKLKGKTKSAYKKLISDEYKKVLSDDDPIKIPGCSLVAIGATVDGQPIGLVVGAFRPSPLPSELYSLFVDPSWRHREVGKRLLNSFVSTLKEKGCTDIKVTYQLEQPTTLDFENLITANSWIKGSRVMVRTHFNAAFFNPPWLHKEYLLPPDFEQFMWADLKKEEKERIEHLIDQGAVPYQVSPFMKGRNVDMRTSVGIRTKDEVIGWMITTKMGRDTLEYRSFFVFPEYYLQKQAMRLLSQSILIMQQHPPRHAFIETYLNNVDRRWVKFVKNRLNPYADKIERFADAWYKFQ